MKLRCQKFCRALTLVEMLVAVSCGSLMMAAVLTAGVALQRSFAAVDGYSISEGDQLRILDYIAMDCRRSLSATVANNTLTLTLPFYYDSTTYAANTPTLTNGTLSYGSGMVTITYSQSGSNFNRQVTVQDSGGNPVPALSKTTAIATNVASFTVTDLDLTSSLSCSITFFPTFKYQTGSGTWRSGGTAPDDAVGVDGDLYVVNSTATDQTTVGNVYRRSGGTYALLQNVKATTVYSNTFLRNASARH